MCVNAKTSITAFILGTIINIAVILYFKTNIITIICIMWEWVIMMQLSEFLIWKDQKCGKINKIGTDMALFFNLTQPLFVYILLFIIIIHFVIYNLLLYNRNNEQ